MRSTRYAVGSCVAVIVVLLAPLRVNCAPVEVGFDELRKDPNRYDRQTVIVSGLFEVLGDENYLWRDVKARARNRWRTDPILVVPDLGLKPFPGTNMSPDSPANLKFAKVTGVVYAHYHGRWGMDRFGLIQKKVDVLPGARQKQFLNTLAWFKNDSGHDVQVDIKMPHQESMSGIGRGQVSETTVDKERVVLEIRILSRKVYDKSGKLLARYEGSLKAASQYYDPVKRAFYYRIAGGTITSVLPGLTKAWDFPPTPDRD